jgi:glycosyltransferase involved in cell wall biosynthesis
VKVALVTNVLASYRVPCFRQLARLLEGRVEYFVMTESLADRDYVMSSEDPSDLTITPLAARRRWQRNLFDDIHLNDVRPILEGDFDVVILGGWAEPTLLLLWLRLLARRTRVLVWSESTNVDLARSWPKEALKRLILRGVAGCIVPGSRAGAYCEQLGVDPSRVFVAPNASDRSFFRSRADQLLETRAQLREEQHLDTLTLLFVGRLTHEFKCIGVLPEAVAALEARGLRVSMLIVGAGPDGDWCRERASALGCRDVRFLGSLDRDELCRVYAAADLLIAPGRSDPWGFVINEAMEFGLPIVASDCVGAAADLIDEGSNGSIVPVGDAVALANAVAEICADEARRVEMGRASREKIASFGPEHWAEGVATAIDRVL